MWVKSLLLMVIPELQFIKVMERRIFLLAVMAKSSLICLIQFVL